MCMKMKINLAQMQFYNEKHHVTAIQQVWRIHIKIHIKLMY